MLNPPKLQQTRAGDKWNMTEEIRVFSYMYFAEGPVSPPIESTLEDLESSICDKYTNAQFCASRSTKRKRMSTYD